MELVVYINVLTDCGYLKYVDNSAHRDFHDCDILGFFTSHFDENCSNSKSAVSSSTAPYTFFKSAINAFISLYETYFVLFLI